jgi:cytochrome P450
MLVDPDFVPFQPPPRPLGLRGLPTLWRNYIETIPQPAYEQGVTRVRTRYSDVLLVCEPDVIGEILVEKADAFGRDPATRRSFKPVVGENSIFVAEGAEWRWQRRAAAPIFRPETILSFVSAFAAMAERQVKRWKAAQSDGPVDAAAAMTRTTFDIIVESMLGGSASLDPERYSRALTENFDTIPWHLIYTMFAVPEWMPFPNRSRAMRSRDFLHRDMRCIIETRRAKPSAQPDLLDQLLAARDPETGRGMSDAEVVNNLLTFIAAGHETTAVALTWTLWLLAKDQTSQQRAYDEVANVVGTGPFTAAHIDRLVFCRQVISEAMRLYPAHRASDAFRTDRWCSAARRSAPGPASIFPYSLCTGIRDCGRTRMLSTLTASPPTRLRRARVTLSCRSGAVRGSVSAQVSPPSRRR